MRRCGSGHRPIEDLRCRRGCELTLHIPDSHTLAARQSFIDALPVMRNLRILNLCPSDRHTQSADPQLSAQLSLEPLLLIPQLTELIWSIGAFTLPQLTVVKQIETLRILSSNYGEWSAEQLSFLSEPPHRLDQLEELCLFQTEISVAHMAALIRLPGIKCIKHNKSMPLDAFALLPRLPRLQELSLPLPQLVNSDAESETLHSSLRACSALTWVVVDGDECSEAVGERLLRALPHLRKLSIHGVTLPSLRFLRHAPPSLTELELLRCKHLRAGHILALGSLVPRLERLDVFDNDALLDRTEVQALTPPGAIGLSSLRTFIYDVSSDEEEEE